MMVQSLLKELLAGHDLDAEQMRGAMREIMEGEASPAQIAGFLVALRLKGETVTEITAAAEVMREKAQAVPVSETLRAALVDTCGTGGDGAGLFNVSTATALLLAALGVPVAKHGNRSVSSKSGSADVLATLGVNLELSPEQAAQALQSSGFAFLFAPLYHPAMKHAIGPRRELGIRTIFNVLGPLTNPAGAQRQVLGVFDEALLRPLAEVLCRLGSKHALVVHGTDSTDEISACAATKVCEMRDGEYLEYVVEPEHFGLQRVAMNDLVVESAEQSAQIIKEALGGTPGAATTAIAMNAGAGLYVAGQASSLAAGVSQALAALEKGIALDFLTALQQQSRD
nr:anthranilate phosphoribosyltransferase [Oceanococcus sp. HetDA_MAG_MS8]